MSQGWSPEAAKAFYDSQEQEQYWDDIMCGIASDLNDKLEKTLQEAREPKSEAQRETANKHDSGAVVDVQLPAVSE